MSILSLQKQSQNTDFPNVRPSLDLRFALAKKLDPRITFTRGSTGTYFGPDGLMRTAGVNEPRFDHNPISGQSLGLLIEESRQNLLTYSGDVSNAAWGKGNSSIGSAITAPDGSSTGYKVIENTTNNYHFVSQSVGTISGDYTVSCFVKAAERYKGYIQLLSSGGNSTALFNLQTGTITTGGTGTNRIIPYPNGWYRITSTLTFTSASATVYFVINRDDGTPIYTGDNNSGIYVWGLQVEAGALPTSYIPTSGSTVTRSADNASMTGTNFSSWYNQSEGTLYASAAPSTNAAYSGWIYLLGTDFNNGISYYRQSDYQPVIRIRSGQRDEYNKITGAVGFGQIWRNAITLKSAFSFKTNDFNSRVSGISVNGSRATAGTLPTFTGPLYLGGLNDGTQKLNGTISRLTYYPIQITNQQLINLTS